MALSTDAPEIWIGLPCYNESENLPKLIDSLLSQSYSNIVLHFFDNASTDNSVEIIKSFQSRDSRIKLRCFDVHVNPFYQGLRLKHREKSADFVSYRSCNDQVDPNFYRETMRLLQDDYRIGLAYSHGMLQDLCSGDVLYADPATRIDTRGLNIFDSAFHVVSRYTYPFALWGLYRRSVAEKLQTIDCYGADHVAVCEASLYRAVAPTEQALDVKKINGNEPVQEGISRMWRTHHRLLARGLEMGDPYMTLDVWMPFTSMIRGHLDMVAGSFVSTAEKASIQKIAIETLSKRFAAWLAIEQTTVLNILEASDLKGILSFNKLAFQDIAGALALVKETSPDMAERCNRLMLALA